MADGYGYGHGYRQHHWGKGGKGFGEHGLPNLAWALAWEGHAGLHFFTRFPKGVVNPFIYSLPEGFTIERKWWGQDGDHWSTTHDVGYEGTNVNKRIQLVGSGFAPGSLMMWDGNRDKGAWIVKSWPQYALATPKGDRHIWYRGTFQFEHNNGNFYSGYWEMDIHFRKPNPKMPNPYVVKFWPETWASKPHYWHFYEREEVEESTYDQGTGTAGNGMESKRKRTDGQIMEPQILMTPSTKASLAPTQQITNVPGSDAKSPFAGSATPPFPDGAALEALASSAALADAKAAAAAATAAEDTTTTPAHAAMIESATVADTDADVNAAALDSKADAEAAADTATAAEDTTITPKHAATIESATVANTDADVNAAALTAKSAASAKLSDESDGMILTSPSTNASPAPTQQITEISTAFDSGADFADVPESEATSPLPDGAVSEASAASAASADFLDSESDAEAAAAAASAAEVTTTTPAHAATVDSATVADTDAAVNGVALAAESEESIGSVVDVDDEFAKIMETAKKIDAKEKKRGSSDSLALGGGGGGFLGRLAK